LFRYGSAYDTLGQPGNKDFSSSYSTGNGAGKSSGGGSQAPAAGGKHKIISKIYLFLSFL